MSRINKVFSLSLSQIVLMLSGIISSMVFSRTLEVRDYGTYMQTFLAYQAAMPFLTLGIPSALYYLLPRSENKVGFVIDCVFILSISALLFSFFLYFGGNKLLASRFNNNDLLMTLKWLTFYPLYTVPILILSSVLIFKNEVKINAVYNTLTGLLTTLLLIFVALFSKSFEIPILIRVILPLVFLPIALYLIFKNLSGKFRGPNLKSIKSILHISLPLGIATILGTTAVQLSNIIVSLYSSPEDFAIFSNGTKEVPFIGIITGSISVIIMADMAKYIKEGEHLTAVKLFNKAAHISAIFLFPIFCFLFVFAESFINILYSAKYMESVFPFRIYLIIVPIRIAFYGSAFVALGLTKEVLYRSIIDFILTLILTVLFIELIGPFGAALGLICTLYFWSTPYNLFKLSKEFGCKMKDILPFDKLFKVFCISFISTLPSLIVKNLSLNVIAEFILGFIVYFLVYFSITIKYSEEFKSFVLPYYDKYIKKIVS